MENQSFVDRSDFLALRSVDEAEEGKEAEVGGISNIPMFSSSEEKLLEYNSLQVKKKCCQLFCQKTLLPLLVMQGGNFMTFLPLGCYVKSILEKFGVSKTVILAILEAMNFDFCQL